MEVQNTQRTNDQAAKENMRKVRHEKTEIKTDRLENKRVEKMEARNVAESVDEGVDVDKKKREMKKD